MVLSVDEVCSLFTGDADSLGYAHQELVVELCSRCGKTVTPSLEWCIDLLYPDGKLSPEVAEVVSEGVKLWYRRGRPRHS